MICHAVDSNGQLSRNHPNRCIFQLTILCHTILYRALLENQLINLCVFCNCVSVFVLSRLFSYQRIFSNASREFYFLLFFGWLGKCRWDNVGLRGFKGKMDLKGVQRRREVQSKSGFYCFEITLEYSMISSRWNIHLYLCHGRWGV